MASSGRPLAAAPPTQSTVPPRQSDQSSRDPNRDPSASKRPKRTLIESACSACRRRKSKCDGIRPACSRCQALDTECVYEAEEGESRWSALRRKTKDIQGERDELREILAYLQSQPEADAYELLHRLRSSSAPDDLPSILQQIRERRSSTSTPTAAGGQTRLPPIRSLLEGSEASTSLPGSGQLRRTSLASDGSSSYESSLSGGHPRTSQSPSA